MLDEFNKLGFHTIHNFFDVNLINKIIKETNPLFEHTDSDSNILQVHEKAPSIKEIIFDERLNELVTKSPTNAVLAPSIGNPMLLLYWKFA